MSTHVEVDRMVVRLGANEWGIEQYAFFAKARDNNITRRKRDALGFEYETWCANWYEVIRGNSGECFSEIGLRASACWGGCLQTAKSEPDVYAGRYRPLRPSQYVALWEKAMENAVDMRDVQEWDIRQLLFKAG
jgi:hypothetical protein